MKVDHNTIARQLSTILAELTGNFDVALTTVQALIQASLFGIDSHGIRLFPHYVGEVKRGRIDGKARPSYQRHGSFLDCDANWGFSHFAARGLLTRLGEIAAQQGIALGTIRNSDHIGALGIHAFNANLPKNIVLCFTNANALAVPPNGSPAVFGTNPIALVSGSNEDLVYIDLSTTVFTMNKVKLYGATNTELPHGVARDQDFEPTTDPLQARYLEAIGGHKGFALAFLVEVLTSGLTGGPHSVQIPDMYSTIENGKRNLSHTFIVIDPTIAGNGGANGLIARTTALAVGDGNQDEIPGKRETLVMRKRTLEGIPIDAATRAALEEVGVEF